MFLYPSFWEHHTEPPSWFLGTMPTWRNMQFSTQLNGGFSTAALEIPCPDNVAFARYRRFLGAHMVLFDLWGRRVYEGRVNDTTRLIDGVGLLLDGYFSYGRENIHGMVYTTSPTTVYTVVHDCIDLQEDDTWQEKYCFVDSGADVDICALEDKDYQAAKVGDVLNEVLKLGYKESDARATYFAIWEHRIPHFFTLPGPISQTWHIEAHNLLEGFDLSCSRAQMWNSISGVFESDAGPVFASSAPAENQISIDIHGKKEGIINVGRTYEAHADALQDAALDAFAWPQQAFSLTISGLVKHSMGFYDYPFRIRAGDAIMITGLDPYVAKVGGSSSQSTAGVWGWVMSTTYQADDGTLDMTINSNDTRFEVLVSRLGVSGGLT
jgi:hypothetical protein